MTPLPFDLIRLVIDHVDNSSTLYSLLTVSKDVFPIAARALYRDPLWSNITNGDRLIYWLLTLSPVDDKDTNVLRQACGLGPKKEIQPSLDYIQLVRGMRWDNARFSSTSDRWEFPRGHPMSRDYGDSGQSSPRAVFIRTTLTWAVCSPVLENIEHLYVEENDMQRYITAANRLRNIQTIVVNVQQNYDNACEKAIKLIRRIHEIHGKNRLRDCRLLPNPFSPVYRSSGDYDVTKILRLYSLLPPNAWTPMRIPRTDGGMVVLDRVFDRDIAELDQVEVIASNVLQHYYSDLTRGEILQRFRSIKKLSVGLSLNDTRVFEWAADEARYRQAHSASTQSSKWIPPAVPVEDLSITFGSQSPPLDLQPISDALCGFADTLKCFSLTIPLLSSLRRMEPVTRTLTYLHSLFIRSGTALAIHPSLWTNLPCLQYLNVDFYRSDFGGYSDEDPVWPAMNIPTLKRLHLGGQAGRMLNPNSLYNMPKLEQLTVKQLYGRYPSTWATKISELWRDTWDWSLPCLTQLELEANAWLVGIRFEFLKKCPRLERIQISGGYSDREPQSLKVLPEPTTTPTTKTAVGAGTNAKDCCPSLMSFELNGNWLIEKNELAYLFNHMLPGLTYFCLGSGVKLVDCSDVDFVQITKVHPRCRTIRTPLKRTSPLNKIGLAKNRQSGSIFYMFENDSGYCMPGP